MKEWNPDSCIMDQGNDAIGGSPDHVIMGGVCNGVIPDLIEIGCDIINPVQVSADGMDSAELKREFGKDLTFWGGGVDTQRVLGVGTPQQVREDVKRRLADLMPGGGFVFNAVHNIQGNVPIENIVAMLETVQEFGVYNK